MGPVGKFISPSLICLDMLNLRKSVEDAVAGGADMLHVDILDGYFAPSMPLGLEAVKQIREAFPDLKLDVHMMVKPTFQLFDEVLALKPYQLIIQVEPFGDRICSYIPEILSAGVRAGIALKPGTKIEHLDRRVRLGALPQCSVVLQMAIEPGYASHSVEVDIDLTKKLQELKADLVSAGLGNIQIELDGRVTLDRIEQYKGIVDIFVCGSRCLDKNNLQNSLEDVQSTLY